MGTTLYRKLWDRHVVTAKPDGSALLYVDRHLLHEVTSPQAFEGLRMTGRRIRRPDLHFAVMDHNVPTDPDRLCRPIADPVSRAQIEALQAACKEFGVRLFGLDSDRQGVVHITCAELGLTLPGLTVVCGDSHTATHGAFGALAFGIGTSEVEHVMATQTLWQKPSPVFRIDFDGRLPRGVGAKDMILALMGRLGAAGATGYALEYTGPALRALSMEGRMTVANMTIEAGGRVGLIAPDETTFSYLAGEDRPFAPRGPALERARVIWRTLHSDGDAVFDRTLALDTSRLAPQVTWGTSPGMVADITAAVPSPDDVTHYSRSDCEKALEYMGLRPGQPLAGLPVDVVFIGSCTNGRIDDLRAAAAVLRGRRTAPGVRVLVVPGSETVRRQAESEGLDRVFREAGAEWRHAGCSMCLAMNPDRLEPGQRCASTSNRNFEGRQGEGGRTHLVGPEMAAAAAVAGTLADVRPLLPR